MLRTFLSLLIFATLISCSKDDEENPGCDRDSWLGTYTVSSNTCDNDIEVAATTTVTAGNSDNEIIFDVGDGDPQSYAIDGCNIPLIEFELDFGNMNLLSISTSGFLEGNDLTIEIETTETSGGNTMTSDCSITVSK